MLPVREAKAEIVAALAESEFVIVVGATGSGKSTQVPQFLVEEDVCRNERGKRCCVTQPRRVAVTSVCRRVCKEMKCQIGTKVGYAMRFERECSQETIIKFATDGYALREAAGDAYLSDYNILILDEAHERSVETDLLLGLAKRAVLKRKTQKKNPLRMIAMSATMDTEILSAFFGKQSTSIIQVPGRLFRVDVFYLRKPVDDYLEAAVQTAFQLLDSIRNNSVVTGNNILVFLPGQEEILSFCASLKRKLESGGKLRIKYQILPLYAALAKIEQEKIFHESQAIKVIASTTIAETSVTIPGVRYVIDPGLVKSRRFCGQTGLEHLELSSASQEQSEQRRGRAGRQAPGRCYRLYPESQFELLAERRPPDIQQTELSTVVLRLLALGIQKPQDFDFLTKPPRAALLRALESLYAFQALDDQASLTSKGYMLAELPLAPLFGNLILLARDNKFNTIADALLALVATLSANDDARSLLVSNLQASAFTDPGSDLLTDLNVYLAFLDSRNKSEFCRAHNIRRTAADAASHAHRQLRAIDAKHRNSQVKNTTPDYDRDLLLDCLVAGLATLQAAVRDHKKRIYTTLRGHHQVFLHPSSVLHGRNPPPDAIVFASCVSTNKRYIRGLSAFSPDRLPDLVPHLFLSSSSSLLMQKRKHALIDKPPPKKLPKAAMFRDLPIPT